MKPKPYRKTKSTKGSNMGHWNPKGNNAGGRVAGTIIGPLSSVGTTDDHPSPDQGSDKGLHLAGGKRMKGKKSAVGPNG